MKHWILSHTWVILGHGPSVCIQLTDDDRLGKFAKTNVPPPSPCLSWVCPTIEWLERRNSMGTHVSTHTCTCIIVFLYNIMVIFLIVGPWVIYHSYWEGPFGFRQIGKSSTAWAIQGQRWRRQTLAVPDPAAAGEVSRFHAGPRWRELHPGLDEGLWYAAQRNAETAGPKEGIWKWRGGLIE